MEDDQYMDDLFGDSEPVHIPPASPPLKGLTQRLDELQEGGCCQRIAWSRNGCIASITPNSRGVLLRIFSRSPSTGTWEFSEEKPLELPPLSDDVQLTHISWSQIGLELAVLDNVGHIRLFSNLFATGRMKKSETNFQSSDDDLGAVVGLYWLPMHPHQTKSQLLWSATRSGERWAYQYSNSVSNEPHNVLENKSALMCLTRNGVLRFMHQQVDGRWSQTTEEIEVGTSARDIFTHSAFANSNENSLLLVAHDAIGQLHLYRIKIIWDSVDQKQSHTATLDVSALLVEERCAPAGSTVEDANSTDSNQTVTIPAQLTHLNFIAPSPEQSHISPDPTIIAVFSHTPNTLTPIGPATTQQNHFSIISRWDFHSSSRYHLHSSFDKLTPKKKSTGPSEYRQIPTLKRQPDFFTNSILLSINPIMYNTAFVLSHSDGVIEIRNRSTFDLITPDYSSDRVSSLPQAGFAYPGGEPSLHTTFSGSACAAATMDQTGVVKLKLMEYSHGSLAAEEDDPKSEAAIAALMLMYAGQCNQYAPGDDILALLPKDMPAYRKAYLLRLCHFVMKLSVDFISFAPHEPLIVQLARTKALNYCLSLQNYMGLKEKGKRDLSGKLAWIILNMRHVAYVFMFTMQTTRQREANQSTATDHKSSLLNAENANTIMGVCCWFLDFLVLMLDDMMSLSKALRDKSIDQDTINQELAKMNSPILTVLLLSLCRGLLRDCFRVLNWINHSLEIYREEPLRAEHAMVYQTLRLAMQDRPVNPRLVGSLIQQVDAGARDCYTRAGITEPEDQARAEREMLITGQVPAALVPLVQKLVTETFAAGADVPGALNPADIIFRDVRWLGLADDRQTREFHERIAIDSIRQVPIPGKPGHRQLRRCTRCYAKVIDKVPQEPDARLYGYWFWTVSRNCICGNGWIVAESPASSEQK